MRGTSTTSASSNNTKFNKLQGDNTSLVRQALKNQKRVQKIATVNDSLNRQNENSSQGSNISAAQRIHRLRVSSQTKVRADGSQEPGKPLFIGKSSSNLPRVNNQKLSVNQRSLSNSGQKILTGVVG